MWVKCTTSAECKTIRIAVSAVMDVLVMPLKVRCWFCFQKDLINCFGISIPWVWAGSLVTGGYPSPLMMNVIQLKTEFEKMNFSYCNCFRTYYMYLK